MTSTRSPVGPCSRAAVTALLVSACLVAAVAAPGSASADDPNDVTAADTYAALASTPGVLADSDTVKTTSDSDSAATSTVGGTVVDIPRDAQQGVTMTQPAGDSIVIVPEQAAGVPAAPVAPGVVAYPGNDGSATAVQATENGGVRVLTVIEDPSAPEEYTYRVSVPGGGSVSVNPDGSASVADSTGVQLSQIQAPWATDGDGTSVPTYFTSNGQDLTQHIAFRSGTYAFPIKADPWFWSYLSCIFGAGVPAGTAIWLAAEVGTTTFITAVIGQRKYIPAGTATYKAMAYYAQRVYNACRNFIRS